MPILGKTANKKESIDLDVIGRVWVGDPKTENSAGKTLGDKFRIECNDATREKFIEHYKTDRPDHLNILLPYATADECFHTWMEAYTAQGFQHRCNGDRIIQEMVKTPYTGLKGEQMFSWERKDVDKPCLKGDAPECAACGKGGGRFFFYIRELYAAGMGATKAWMMSVSGTHNLLGLHAQLCALQKQYGQLDVSPVPSPWTYGFIPYTLTRVQKQITRPNQEKTKVNGRDVWQQTGTRSKGSYWAISISEEAEWLATLQKFMAYQEVQRLGGSEAAIALIGGDIPLLQGYQSTEFWGRTVRGIKQATSRLQLAEAIDTVRNEASQGNISESAVIEAERLADEWINSQQKAVSTVEGLPEDESDRVTLNAQIEQEMARIHLTKKKAVEMLDRYFQGAKKRDDLTLEQLQQFAEILASMKPLKSAEPKAIDPEVQTVDADVVQPSLVPASNF